MADSNGDEEEIMRYLDLPSSELGIEDNFSEDDDDWHADPMYRPTPDSENSDSDDNPDEPGIPNVVDLLGDENTQNMDDPDDPEPIQAGPSNAKRPRKAPRKRQLKVKTFKPKKKRVSKNKNNKKKQPKYTHLWNSDNFIPTIFEFDASSSGIVNSNSYPEHCSGLHCFEKMIPDSTLEFIVAETNKHFDYIFSHSPPSEKSRLQKWTPLTLKELKVFLAITMLMVHNKKIVMENYWSTDPLQKNSVPMYMSKNRYLLILRLLHFSDNTQTPRFGRLSKIKEVVDMFRKCFSKSFKPFRNLCIDESLLLFKGQLGFKQFIPSKRSIFGIKTFLLCDCETGYVLDLIVYTGNDSEIIDTQDLGKSGAIITTLLSPYLNKGHCLYVDNWYSSPDLFRYLHLNKTNACGTVRFDRLGMPEFQKELEVGHREVYNDETSLVVRWIDKRDVLMITSEHEDTMVRTGKCDPITKKPIVKPKSVHEYNCNMGAVDRSDMMIVGVESVRRTQRWYKKLFFHLMDLAILNAHALYLCKTGEKPTLQQFHLEIVRKLLEENCENRPKKKGGRPSSGDTPQRLTSRHFPVYVPPTEKKAAPCRQCHVCKNTRRREQKRRESRYMCAECDVALCAVPCFAEFHTLKDY